MNFLTRLETLYELDLSKVTTPKLSFVSTFLDLFTSINDNSGGSFCFEHSPCSQGTLQLFSDHLSKLLGTKNCTISVLSEYCSQTPHNLTLFFSGGVESTYLALRDPTLATLNIPGVDYRYPNGVELPLILLAHLLGFNPVLGIDSSLEYANTFPIASKNVRVLLQNCLNLTIHTPLLDESVTKLDALLALEAMKRPDAHLLPTPCFNAEQSYYHARQDELLHNLESSGNLYYCGNCFKCWAMGVMYALPNFKSKPKYKVSDECLTRHAKNLKNFDVNTGKYSRDMSIFLIVTAHLRSLSLNVDDFWRQFQLAPHDIQELLQLADLHNLKTTTLLRDL